MKLPITCVLASTALAVCASALPGCHSAEQDRVEADGRDASSSETPAGGGTAATQNADPCSLLSIEELRMALPGLKGPAQPDPLNHQCVYSHAFVKVARVSRDELELEYELFGLEPRAIEVPKADWAVMRIDTDDGQAVALAEALPDELTGSLIEQPDDGATPEVFDVIATGSAGTVTLAPTGDYHPALDSAEHDALIRLLELAYSRL